MAATSLYAQKAISRKTDIPNPKDRAYWLAGGDLRNDTLAGGILFDTQSTPAIYNLPRSGSAAVAFNAGTVLEYLNSGYMGVLNVLNGSGFLDLMNDYTLRNTAMLYYTLTMTTTNGTIYTKTNLITSGSGRNGNTDGIQGSTTTGTTDLATAQKAMNAKFNALGMVAKQDIISMGFTAFDLATGKISSTEVAIAGGLIGSVKSIATAQITGALVGALGTTSVASVLGVGYVVGIVLGEVMEMAMGLDNSFGFGGEFVGYDVTGKAQYSAPVSFTTGLMDLAMEVATLGKHVSTTDFNIALSKSQLTKEARDAFARAAATVNEINSTYGSNISTDGAYASDLATGSTTWGGFKEAERELGLDGKDKGGGKDDDTDRGGYSETGSVICTALANKYNVFTKKELVMQMRHTKATYPKWVYNGYLLWGSYIANKIQEGRYVSMWKYIMTTRWLYLKTGYNVVGFITNSIVVGLSYIFGLAYKFKLWYNDKK